MVEVEGGVVDGIVNSRKYCECQESGQHFRAADHEISRAFSKEKGTDLKARKTR